MTAPKTEKMNFAGKKDQILPSCAQHGLNFLFLFVLLYRSCYLLFFVVFVFALKPDSHEQDIFSIRNRRTKRAPPFLF